ncbi:motility associated factor glycosyltransferase family protein [Selenihalanaerobacter shriftii]|uniref:Uncharacterized conserved protein n=1 Tax=Selenihalanaerobacter shriftii TaxID=142842 RepID=A0A1T4KNN9_9FIRM|nr:6-hydroxymethylpterin diphosphokinase MptE-like protein [Selenihalanaerobacter shriftii]SJZ44003.1 Uncharacterized conserved protein [Selenihalanaerobacter shriftii]
MAFFNKNMRLLKRKSKMAYNIMKNYHQSDKIVVDDKVSDQDIIAQVKDLENDLIINIEETKNDGYTMQIIKDKKPIYFHSRYYPVKEAKKLVDNLQLKYNSQDQIFALGFGLGYHLVELFTKDKFNRVFIIEPYLSIFYTALLYSDLRPILKNEKFILVIGDKGNLYSAIRANYELSLANKIKFFEHPPSLRLFNEEYDQIYNEIRNAIEYKNISKMTNIKVAKQWRNNIISNLSYILKNPKADDFFNSFQNIPIICVAAGPSLDKNIDQLKHAKGNALLMCVGTALKALLKAGIEPDIVVSMDGSQKMYNQFKGIRDLNNVFLFSEKANSPLVNDNWVGPQVFFTMKRNLSAWVEKMKGQYTAINTGGTVAHSMVDLAYKFGGNPIILVGQDLSFSEDKTHASGTMYENNKVNDEGLITVEGINGKPVYTSKGFKSFLNYYNDYFAKRSSRLYIDATEGGAKIDHTKIMTLQEAIAKYCLEKVDPLITLQEIYNEKEGHNDYYQNLKEEIDKTIEELNSSIEILEEQLSFVKGIEKKLTQVQQISNGKLKEVQVKAQEYESKLKQHKRISYFTQRTLIIEKLKYQEVNNKYFFNNKQELEEKMKYYRTYWTNYWQQLKTSLELLKKMSNQIDENKVLFNEDKIIIRDCKVGGK